MTRMILIFVLCGFFFGMNKSKSTTDPAFFDVTSITVPVGATVGIEASCTIYISNTGDYSDTQDVTIVWRKGGIQKYSHAISKFIDANSAINFNDLYTPLEAGSDWTIYVQTDDDSLESGQFTVNPD